MSCDHSGTHTGRARQLRGVGQLRLVLVCDECGAECVELGRIDYRTEARLGMPPRPRAESSNGGSESRPESQQTL